MGCAPTSTRDQMRMLVGRAEARRLLLHVFDQLRPLNALGPAGKVLDQRGDRKLAAGLVALQNQRFQSRRARCRAPPSVRRSRSQESRYREYLS